MRIQTLGSICIWDCLHFPFPYLLVLRVSNSRPGPSLCLYLHFFLFPMISSSNMVLNTTCVLMIPKLSSKNLFPEHQTNKSNYLLVIYYMSR